MTQFYNCMVKERPLKVKDLVLREKEVAGKDVIQGKLTSKWEGSYIIT